MRTLNLFFLPIALAAVVLGCDPTIPESTEDGDSSGEDSAADETTGTPQDDDSSSDATAGESTTNGESSEEASSTSTESGDDDDDDVSDTSSSSGDDDDDDDNDDDNDDSDDDDNDDDDDDDSDDSSDETTGDDDDDDDESTSDTTGDDDDDDDESTSETTGDDDDDDDFNPDNPPGSLSFDVETHKCRFAKWHLTSVDFGGGEIEKMKVDIEIDMKSTKCTTNGSDDPGTASSAMGMTYFFTMMYPTATLTIENATSTGGDSYKAMGNLTLRGITKEVPLTFELVSESSLKFKGEGTIDRTVFEVGQNDPPQKEIPLTYDIMLKK